MSEVLRELVVALSLDSDNFSRNMRTINQQIKEAESTFRLAGAGIENFEKTVAGTESKLSMLGQKLTQQNRAVEQYSRALVAANQKLVDSYNRQERMKQSLADTRVEMDRAKTAVDAAKATYERYASTLGESDSATIAAKGNLELAQQEYQELADKVKLLEGQIKSNSKTMQNNADAISKAKTNLNNAKAAVKDTEAEIKKLTEELYRLKSGWTTAGEALTAFSKKCEALSKGMTSLGRGMTTAITTPIVALGATAIKSSISFESAFTSVRKTVDATEEEFAALSGEIKQMSTEIATSAEDIAEVVAIAGQLGIENEHLMEFARTMIDLGNSTDIVAEEAASTLAKFANIMQMDQSLFGNLGAALVDLGNNYATTESAIMEMSMRLAGAGHQVGLSEAQILAFATALSSLGIEAEMGGSAFSKALVKMEVAAATGGEALEDFAKISGLSAQQFKTLWENDPAAAFQAFIEGLAQMDEEGMSAIATLNEIGIAEVRLRDTLLRATNAHELFTETQATANAAWNENLALTTEAEKRYATTQSKLINLKNTALLFAQQIGDDLNPTIQELIDKGNELLNSFLQMDESQRQAIIKFAAFAAAAGPAILVLGKTVGAVGQVTSVLGKAGTALGKFSAKVSMAGGGIGGFVKVLGSSKLAMVALAAALVYGAIKLADYASGAKEAREALEGMAKVAEDWKNNAAETFYGSSEGLSFFGMSESDFTRELQSAEEWMNGLIAVWTDGEKESDEIVEEWTNSFKELTASTRTELEKMKADAQAAGYTSVVDQISTDIETLDAMDKEIERLLRKRQNGFLTEAEKIRLAELIDTREAIEIKYNLSPADPDGFETIRKKVEAEVARANARSKSDASVTVYENAIVAAAQGMAAVNAQIDEQYDKEYALIQLIEDSSERRAAQEALDARYLEQRRVAAMEYAETLAAIVMPVWNSEDIQQAGADVDALMLKLREYTTATESEKPAILTQLEEIAAGMDEGALTEYVALLTQIQSLLDSGMTEEEVQAMFPEIDFSEALSQIAAIQTFLNGREAQLPGLQSMFGDALPEEVLTITTDLDMTGAQQRWDEFAEDPGAITTEAIIEGYQDEEAAKALQPQVDAFIAKYTEVPEGASTAELTPEGLIGYVDAYAEVTTGADVTSLTPTNIVAMVSAYEELAAGADISTLKPDEITAYIYKYLEKEGVDTTGLKPEDVTAFVMAYEEITGGALTTQLAPSDVVAMVAKYLEAENIDVSDLSPDQIEAIVSSFAEATGCDKSQLLTDFTAYITKYDDTNAVKPNLSMSVGIYGYDLLAYRRFIAANPVEVQGIVKLGEAYENPTDALNDPQTKFWQNGVQIPVEAVPSELLTADKVAVLGEDGTLHVLIAPEVTGTQEAIDAISPLVDEVDQFGTTLAGMWAGVMPTTTMDLIGSAVERMNSYTNSLEYTPWERFWASLRGESTNHSVLDQSMNLDFSPETVAELSAYVAEVVSAIQQGKQVSEQDVQNLQDILTFLQGLDTTETGQHILEGVAAGMTEGGWDSDAETVASNLESALNLAFGIQSPSTRVKPVGSNVAAGVGVGMTEYDFTTDASSIATAVDTALNTALTSTLLGPIGTNAITGMAQAMTSYSMTTTGSTVASNVQSAVNASLTSSTLRSAGVNAMAGLKAGINAGRSGVISAMRSAARAAVNAAKSELKIKSPSRVFKEEVGVQTMRGFGLGVLEETKAQARIIRNASRYLTGEAKEGAIAYNSSDNRRTYNQQSSVNLSGNTFYVRDEQDIRSLAVEIATLTRRQQRGKGLRFA